MRKDVSQQKGARYNRAIEFGEYGEKEPVAGDSNFDRNTFVDVPRELANPVMRVKRYRVSHTRLWISQPQFQDSAQHTRAAVRTAD